MTMQTRYKPKISPKQEQFLYNVAAGMTFGQAALKAGYKKGYAVSAGEMLKRPHLKKRLEEIKQESLSEDVVVKIGDITKELTCSAFFDPIDIFTPQNSVKNIKELPENARRAISRLEVIETFDEDGILTGYVKKIWFNNKLDALDKLGKHVGYYQPENAENEDGLKKPIQIVNFGNINLDTVAQNN